jgi:multidrug efflux pump subunit AcrA (membrane-fusion protein)
MKVNVKVDALPKNDFPAKVTLVSPQADKDSNNLKSFKVEVSLLENDRRLKPGMTARVDGLLEAHKDVVKIPLSAIFEEKGQDVAYRKDGEDSERVELTLGLRNETEAEVKDGASEGQKFFTEKPKEEKKKSKWFGKKAKKGDKKKDAKKTTEKAVKKKGKA